MAKIVVGLFDDFSDAQDAVQDLVKAGFRREDISVTASDARGERARLGAPGASGSGSGAATGAGTGAALGGVAGLLVGLGALAIPGIGPVVAAGPLAAALAGAGVGAVTGGLVGSLTDLGVPEEAAHRYAEGVRRGGSLVAVAADAGNVDAAVSVMNLHGAVDIERRAADWRQQGWTGFNHAAQPLTPDEILGERERFRGAGAPAAPAAAAPGAASAIPAAPPGEVRLPVVEEELQVGKREVDRGGVRIYSRVEETPVQETVQLREERVSVERRPADRPLTDADPAPFQERTIEVRETAEEVVVAKKARVAEEVVIRKDVEHRTETVQDTVRRTEVDVEQAPASRGTPTRDPGR